MILQWFNARQASEAGAALADKLTPAAARMEKPEVASSGALQEIVKRASKEVRDLRLNFYQRAKLANAFKWKLIENGIEREVADRVTSTLVMDLSLTRGIETAAAGAAAMRAQGVSATELLAKANSHAEHGDVTAAIEIYKQLLEVDPANAAALNNMGSALTDLGRFIEAEQYYRRALSIDASFVDAHCNLGNVLRRRGFFAESEASLRRAIKLKPNYLDAHNGLGLALVSLGRLHQAKGRFRKVLKSKPRDAVALYGMGEVAMMEGRWEDAERQFAQTLEKDPANVAALVAQAGMRKMTSHAGWLETAQRVADSGLSPPQEAALRYAIGKYHDDVGDFDRAFQSFKSANEILKRSAEPYDRKWQTALARDLTRAYTRETLANAAIGASDSTVPVFVVGMPRSGTSLVEQIIASHPLARGAGEIEFWSNVMRDHESVIRQGLLPEGARKELAVSYLRALQERVASTFNEGSSTALRIVDKAPVNSNYLGVIHSVFPKARIIYMRRDPIDTCLSCYFQNFPLTLNHTLDLADLAHYYEEHQRLINHWRAVLPPGAILEVRYEALVAEPEQWIRSILKFIDLDWDPQCLRFEQTQRAVATASYWQVRQRIFGTSVARWRNYERFIRPLLSLREG
jgi:tetratricopeptide (TPR) repeat protein